MLMQVGALPPVSDRLVDVKISRHVVSQRKNDLTKYTVICTPTFPPNSVDYVFPPALYSPDMSSNRVNYVELPPLRLPDLQKYRDEIGVLGSILLRIWEMREATTPERMPLPPADYKEVVGENFVLSLDLARQKGLSLDDVLIAALGRVNPKMRNLP